MSRIRKYNVIEQKLGQMPGPDMDALWADMRERLDQQLPEDKERKRMFWWWRVSGVFLVVPVAIFITAIVLTLAVPRADKTANLEQSLSRPTEQAAPFHEAGTVMDLDAHADEPGLVRNTISIEKPQTIIPGGKTNSLHEVQTPRGSHKNLIEPAPVLSSDVTSGMPQMNTAAVYQQVQTAPGTTSAGTLINPVDRVGSGLWADAVMQRSYSASLQPMLQPMQVRLGMRTPARGLADTMQFPLPLLVQQEHAAHAKKFSAGVAVHLNLPLSSQEMSTIAMNGGKNRLVDYMPSLYGQFHFHKRLFVQSEFQFIVPQHTPNLTLESAVTPTGPNRRQEHSVQLTKLYYMNIPVSLHYQVLPDLYVGAGIQYAYLTRSILTEETATWQDGNNGWEKKTSDAKVHVKKNPKKEKEKFKKENNGQNPVPVVLTPVDVVAQKFKSSDLRFTYDINYYRRRFNAGIRMNIGTNNYIDTQVGATNIQVQDRNKSFQAYIRYQFW